MTRTGPVMYRIRPGGSRARERDAGAVWLIGLTVAALVPMLLPYRSLLGQSLLGGAGLTLAHAVNGGIPVSAVARVHGGSGQRSSNPLSA